MSVQDRSLHWDWLPERAIWRYLARSELPSESRKKKVVFFAYNKSFIDQACSGLPAGSCKNIVGLLHILINKYFIDQACSGLPAGSCKNIVGFLHILINKSFIDQACSLKWLDTGLFFSHSKTELGQYLAILTSRLINNHICLNSASKTSNVFEMWWKMLFTQKPNVCEPWINERGVISFGINTGSW